MGRYVGARSDLLTRGLIRCLGSAGQLPAVETSTSYVCVCIPVFLDHVVSSCICICHLHIHTYLRLDRRPIL